MSYPLNTLGELCNIVIGRTPFRSEPSYWGKGNKWVSISDLNGKIVSDTKEEITDHAVTSARCRRVAKGTLLFSFKLTIGKMAFAGRDLFTNEAIAALEIKDSRILAGAYLYYALQSAKYGGSNQAAKGKTLNSKSLAEIKIPLPLLNDQIHIAHLLGKVEGLIAQRKQHLQQLDDLLKSVFLEMFGDPVRNERGWNKKPLAQLGNLDRGVSKHRPRNAPELLGGKYPLIQTGDVSNAGTYITTHIQTYSELGFAQSKLWPAGTLCITIAANIAQTSILTFDACFPDSVVGFASFKNESNTLYVHGLFWFFQRILERDAPAAAQKNINLKILRELSVPAPPPELQNQFAAIVEKVEGVKTRYQQSLDDLENLYGALSQKAFKGELDLSRVLLQPATGDLQLTGYAPSVRVDTVRDQQRTIDLPDVENMVQELATLEGRRHILQCWLDAYLAQLKDTTFSVKDFLMAAQVRMSELRPEDNFEIGITEYDQLKEWVFAALGNGMLSQVYDDPANRVQLIATNSQQV